MSYQEKKNVVNIISALVISGIYYWYVVSAQPLDAMTTDELLYFWAKSLLIFMPISIVSRIVIHIIFAITNTIATREKIPSSDERDKLIELKSTRNAQYFFGAGFIIAMIYLVIHGSVTGMFVIIISAGILSEVLENSSQLYFYRRGI